ncbi:hypothetical protein DMP06_07160 [Slackia equolifaciens]|uniref:Uncharacterized protein n=1 Tax=Slackia equolifaciens TaxID=498718 RepID=A0A3N0AXF1_9ACTN|nr:hypothetical protein DMP06_07160 [Slackia equolifaciens]
MSSAWGAVAPSSEFAASVAPGVAAGLKNAVALAYSAAWRDGWEVGRCVSCRDLDARYNSSERGVGGSGFAKAWGLNARA